MKIDCDKMAFVLLALVGLSGDLEIITKMNPGPSMGFCQTH